MASQTGSIPLTIASCLGSLQYSSRLNRSTALCISGIFSSSRVTGPSSEVDPSSRLPSPFLGSRLGETVPKTKANRKGGPLAVGAELAGQYEESFADVEKQLFDYFTFKAVNTVLSQLLEMNPGQYTFLYNFVVNNKVRDSKLFIRTLVQERQELAERIMVTRLHLYNTWAKKYDHALMRAAIKDQNLELLRERLMETVKFQAEDSEGSTTT